MPFNRLPESGPITQFPAGTFNSLVSVCERVEKERVRFGRTPSRDTLPPSYKYRNLSGEAIERGAILKVTGSAEIKNAVALRVTKPDTSLALNYAIALTPCPASGNTLAECTLFDPARALYDAADGTPAFGQMWGVHPGSFKLRKGRYGFEIQGFPDDGKVLACPMPIRSIACKAGSTIAAGTSGTVTLWQFNGTTWSASTITATAWNLSEAEVPADVMLQAKLVCGAWVIDFEACGGGE